MTTAVPVLLLLGALSCAVHIIDEDMEAWRGILSVYGAPMLYVLIDGALRRATHGMRAMGLRFGTIHAEQIGFWHCLLRILLGVLLIPLLPVSGIIANFDARRRSLADLICRTTVWFEPQNPDQDEPRGFEVLPLEDRQHL